MLRRVAAPPKLGGQLPIENGFSTCYYEVEVSYHVERSFVKKVEVVLGGTMTDLTTNDIIWIEDAAKQYNRTRKWLDEQIDQKRLSVVKIPGDRKVYLVRAELDTLIRPQIIQRAEDSSAG